MTFEDDVAEKPKHVSGHVAMDEQSSHSFALWGQQSISSIAAMSAISVTSVDFTAILVPVAAGSMATESAMRSARMVRPMFMAQFSPHENSRFSGLGVKRRIRRAPTWGWARCAPASAHDHAQRNRGCSLTPEQSPAGLRRGPAGEVPNGHPSPFHNPSFRESKVLADSDAPPHEFA
jgi:hypothetical protein